MEKKISFNFDKKKAITLVKKGISGKMAIIKDGGDTLKVGTPPFMMVNIKVTDDTIEIAASGAGAMLGETAASEIAMLVEEENEKQGGQPQAQAQPAAAAPQQSQKKALSPEDYLQYQERAIALLKQYKDLYDSQVLTEEEFASKKQDVLNFINGMTKK